MRIIPCSQDTALSRAFSALTTDANPGESFGVLRIQTQLLEFIDFEHTPKNILIRAVRRPDLTVLCEEKIFSGSGKHVQGISLRANPVYIIAERLQSMIV